MQMPRQVNFRGNGSSVQSTFSTAEMQRRQDAVRQIMIEQSIDAALFTSYHNICYLADFLHCKFGRRYGLVVDHDKVTSISAGIDGGQPARRTAGDNVTFTDWQRDNMIKSAEEIEHITIMAGIADAGGAACIEALAVGVPEHEVALHSTAAMVRRIADTWPHAELLDTWTWFQSGINTDGAHNPVTSRIIERGDILSMNCFPMVAGYYVALERTLFAETASDENIRLWDINCAVHDRGKELLVSGAKCSDIAKELNSMYAEHDLLQYRSFGYGHSFGVMCHYYGREAGLELREDCETILTPGMVISMEPMITVPDHLAGAGGYREHDILVITDNANDNITGFPYGSEHLVVAENNPEAVL